jgi:hypothetical protein
LIQTVVQALPKQFAECQARFGTLNNAQLEACADTFKQQRGRYDH